MNCRNAIAPHYTRLALSATEPWRESTSTTSSSTSNQFHNCSAKSQHEIELLNLGPGFSRFKSHRKSGDELFSMNPSARGGSTLQLLQLSKYPRSTICSSRPSFPAHSLRHSSRLDNEQLVDPNSQWMARPQLIRQSKKGGTLDWGASDQIRKAYDEWGKECYDPRLRDTGSAHMKRITWENLQRKDLALSHKAWSDVYTHRFICKDALTRRFRPSAEIAARKVCAKLKDKRYPPIYHSLEDQAHILFLAGRVELEREPLYHALAYYMLQIAGGLGQLDAVLLLHQLEKWNSKWSVPPEQRAVLAEAAETHLDWRAMLAECEYAVSKAKGRSGKGTLQGVELDQCLDSLEVAMQMTSPDSCQVIKREEPPEGYIDVETLQVYDPPYKLLLQLTSAEMASGNRSNRIVELFEHATRTGALEYHDPDAAWDLAQWHLQTGQAFTKEWENLATMAASSANVNAIFELAKHRLNQDGWWPSITYMVLDDLKQQHIAEMRRRSLTGEEYSPLVQDEENTAKEILKRRDGKLLQAYDGLSWMKEAAQLHVDNPMKMYNRYCIIVGLLRQNGFLNEGREVLLEARANLKTCVGDETTKSRALNNLTEFLDDWERKAVHELLPPKDIEPLLGSPQREEHA